jgi:membrane protein
MATDRRAVARELRHRAQQLRDDSEQWLPMRILRRYVAIRGTERSLVIAGQCFTAIIPLLIVVVTLTSSADGEALANTINLRFHLTGTAADAVTTLFGKPPGAQSAISLGSVILLIASGLSLSRTLQRTYEAAWELPAPGLRGTMHGLAALGILLSQIMLLSLLASLLRDLPGATLLTFVVRSMFAVVVWLALQYVLLGRRIPWRRLLPGALIAGLGQQLVTAASAIWMPHLITTNTARYGVIGVAFALLSWLLVIAVVLVIAAAVSGELGRSREPEISAAVSKSS